MILSFECSNIPAALTYVVCLSVDMILQVFSIEEQLLARKLLGQLFVVAKLK